MSKKTRGQRTERQLQERDRRWQQTLQQLAGRTIIRVQEHFHGGEWGEHESYTLLLDDGRELHFTGWGHDAWGCTLNINQTKKPVPRPNPASTNHQQPKHTANQQQTSNHHPQK